MNILFQDFLYDMSGGNSPPYLHADGLPHGRGHGIADLPVLVHVYSCIILRIIEIKYK